MALIEIQNINKYFKMGDETIHALNGINLKINENELTSIVGASGSGKSTLMNILGLLDLPNDGNYFLDGIDVTKMSDNELAKYRNQKIGFVFQNFNLLPKSNALKNVEMPLQYASSYDPLLTQEKIKERALLKLKLVGLEDRVYHLPSELSGGQRQRVAIARALVNNPKILLTDEPTGALDTKTGDEILKLFFDLNKNGVTVIIVTHDNNIANRCKRTLKMTDGKLIEDRIL